MAPRKLTLLAVILGVAAAFAITWTTLGRRKVAPPPFPCIVTARSGWLTAVTSEAMLRIEWDERSGRVGASEVHGSLTWEPRTGAEARALALRVLEPISAPIRSNTSDSVSLFAGCDGIGAPWRGESHGIPSYRDCLTRGEVRLDCLRQVFNDRGSAVADEAPGAVADRITAEVTARGVSLRAARRLRSPGYYGPPAPPGLVDDLLEKVLPGEPEPDLGDSF